jgi:hypothetical protein
VANLSSLPVIDERWQRALEAEADAAATLRRRCLAMPDPAGDEGKTLAQTDDPDRTLTLA